MDLSKELDLPITHNDESAMDVDEDPGREGCIAGLIDPAVMDALGERPEELDSNSFYDELISKLSGNLPGLNFLEVEKQIDEKLEAFDFDSMSLDDIDPQSEDVEGENIETDSECGEPDESWDTASATSQFYFAHEPLAIH